MAVQVGSDLGLGIRMQDTSVIRFVAFEMPTIVHGSLTIATNILIVNRPTMLFLARRAILTLQTSKPKIQLSKLEQVINPFVT